SFVQTTNAEVWDEIFFTEGIAGNPKDEPDQPFHAGMQMHKPSLAFAWGGNLDNRALAPIGLAEIPKLIEPVDDPIDDAAFPARFRSGSREALDGVPTPAVDFPRHAGILTDRFQGHISFPRFFRRRRIVLRPFDVRARGQHGGESFRGVRSE